MHTRRKWRRPVPGGMAAFFCSALLAGAGGLSASAPAAALTPQAAARVTLGGTWGTAIEVPGLAALDKGGDGDVESVSCVSPGNCGAAGTYADGTGRVQAFVANQTNGTWGKAIQIPGLAALNVGGAAEFTTLSCASPSNCSAGGEYSPRTQAGFRAFVVTETNGTWGKAIQVPGLAALSFRNDAEVTALSCASPGDCSAAGHYNGGRGRQAFVVNQTNGAWGKAIQIPGTLLTKIGFADVGSVSCRAPGDCTAGGGLTDHRSHEQQSFVVSEKNGTWGKAIEIPGIAALSPGGTTLSELSCGAVHDCSAGGVFQDRSGFFQAWVASERNGTWGKAIEVPGFAALNTGKHGGLDNLSCASPGNCSASGVYTPGGTVNLEPFVVTETNGTWGKAIEVPGIVPLNTDGEAHVFSMSCGAAGNCSVGGSTSLHGDVQAWVVNQAHGTWGKAIEVPGTAALNKGGEAGINSLSCTAPNRCSAGGFYLDSRGKLRGFVVSQT